MSIILEALDKASSKKSAPAIIAEQPVQAPQANNFSFPHTLWLALSVIAIVCAVAFLTANTSRQHEDQTASAMQDTVAEGFTAPTSRALPEPEPAEPSPINSFITKFSNSRFTLNGIVSGIGRPAAIIENRILEEGDSVKGAKVVKINGDSVEMLDLATGQTFFLKVD